MKYHALVVDDNPSTLDDVKDRLESLGHTCDLVESQAEAKDLLGENRYAYVLLDLKIPVKDGRPSRITNGENLLWTIRRTKGFEGIPIIVMTSHGHHSPALAVKVMSNGGANNFVMKPFSDTGSTLGKAIRDALRHTGRSHPGAKSHSELARDPGPPMQFEEGEMVFSETRVELCGVRICDSVGSGLMRAILDILKQKDSRGKFVALSGEELAQLAGSPMTCQNDIADAVRRLRERIKKAMLDQANVKCIRQDVIANDRKYGYSLSRKVTVRDADDVNNEVNRLKNDVNKNKNEVNRGGNDVNKNKNGVKNGVYECPNDPNKIQNEVNNLSVRQQWILAELRSNGEMRKGEIFRGYQKQFSRSKTTLERDLEELRQRGLIRFDGKKRTGCWRCT